MRSGGSPWALEGNSHFLNRWPRKVALLSQTGLDLPRRRRRPGHRAVSGEAWCSLKPERSFAPDTSCGSVCRSWSAHARQTVAVLRFTVAHRGQRTSPWVRDNRRVATNNPAITPAARIAALTSNAYKLASTYRVPTRPPSIVRYARAAAARPPGMPDRRIREEPTSQRTVLHPVLRVSSLDQYPESRGFGFSSRAHPSALGPGLVASSKVEMVLTAARS